MQNNPLCEIDILDEKIQEKIQRDDLKDGLGKYIYLINEFCDKEMNVLEGERSVQFQEVYIDFFQLFDRGLSTEKQKESCLKYFEVMQDLKTNPKFAQKYMGDGCENTAFKMVLQRLYPIQEKVEKSFSSKLLSMINPVDRPPWDSVVKGNLKKFGILEALGIKVPPDTLDKDDKDRNVAKKICAWDTFYTKICELYKDFVNRKTEARKNWMNLFDEIFDEWYKDYFLNETNDAKWLVWLRKKYFAKQDLRRSITDVKIIDLILWQIREK